MSNTQMCMSSAHLLPLQPVSYVSIKLFVLLEHALNSCTGKCRRVIWYAKCLLVKSLRRFICRSSVVTAVCVDVLD